LKTSKGIKQDTELTVDDLKTLVAQFKEAVKKNTGKDFPQDPWETTLGSYYCRIR